MQWSEIKRRAATNPDWQWQRSDALDKLKADCLHRDVWRESGGYVEKGPFPQPSTEIKLQELSRDAETGRVKLRATPVNGDTIYVEIGAPATTASQKLSGRDFETSELIVSFLAVDSTGKHETGEPLTWKNRITIKSWVYGSSGDKRVELRAAPPVPIRYTTDGSDPKVAGGLYDDSFEPPEGSRFVLAVAEDKGIVSDTHQVLVDVESSGDDGGPVPDKPIDKAQPATWKPLSHPEKVFSFTTTQSAYGFIARLQKHEGKAAAQRIAVLDGQWVDLQLADEMLLTAEQIQATLEHLRALVKEGEVTIEASALWFPTGQRLLDYVHDIAVELPRCEVEQSS